MNIETAQEVLTLEDILEISPDTYDKATLVIPAPTLMYGIYKLKFFSRMWDVNEADPVMTHILPFEKDAFTYIEILPTPLIARMVDGVMSYITRGKAQMLLLEPYLYSVDPDFPEEKVHRKHYEI